MTANQPLRISAEVYLEQHGVTAFISYRDIGIRRTRWAASVELVSKVVVSGFGATDLECLAELDANIRLLASPAASAPKRAEIWPGQEGQTNASGTAAGASDGRPGERRAEFQRDAAFARRLNAVQT